MSKDLHIFLILNVFFFNSNQVSKSNTRSQECYIITKNNNKALEGINFEFFSSSTLSSFLPHFLLLFFSLLSNSVSPPSLFLLPLFFPSFLSLPLFFFLPFPPFSTLFRLTSSSSFLFIFIFIFFIFYDPPIIKSNNNLK